MQKCSHNIIVVLTLVSRIHMCNTQWKGEWNKHTAIPSKICPTTHHEFLAKQLLRRLSVHVEDVEAVPGRPEQKLSVWRTMCHVKQKLTSGLIFKTRYSTPLRRLSSTYLCNMINCKWNKCFTCRVHALPCCSAGCLRRQPGANVWSATVWVMRCLGHAMSSVIN